MKKQTKQMLEVTIIAKATFDISELRDLEAWRDEIINYGEIMKEEVKIIEVEV